MRVRTEDMVMVGHNQIRDNPSCRGDTATLPDPHLSRPGGRGTVVIIATFTFIPAVRRWNLCVTLQCILFT